MINKKYYSLHCLNYLKLKKKSLKFLNMREEIPSPEMSVIRQDKECHVWYNPENLKKFNKNEGEEQHRW